MINKKLPLVCLTISILATTACVKGTHGVTYYEPRTAIPKNWSIEQQQYQAEREQIKEQKKQDTVAKQRLEKMDNLLNWWHIFDDQTLNKIIEQLAENNLDLKMAASRIEQARALQGVDRSLLFPSVDISANATRIGTSENSAIGTGAIYNNFGTGIDASWEIDLFGKNRHRLDAARATTEMFEASYNDVMISVIAEVAINYINLRNHQVRLELARRMMEAQYKSYEIIASQNTAGLTDATAVLKARTQLENSRASIPAIKSEIEVVKNRIALLLGKAPNDSELDFLFTRKNTIPDTNIKLTLGIPAETIRRRPDISRAERKLTAEAARVRSRQADIYPSLKLNGSIGLESIKTASLFKYASHTFGLGSIVNWNIFDAGQIKQNLKYQKAVKEESALAYEKAVLNALGEVENSISRFTNEKLREHNLQQAYKATKENIEIAKSKYESGTENLNHYLAAEIESLATENILMASKASAAIELINLYKALGGGWQSFAENKFIAE